MCHRPFQELFVARQHDVPGVVRFDVRAAGRAHRVGKRRVGAEHLDRALELRESHVRNRGPAALRVAAQDFAAALYQRGAALRERFGENHREALEERRLRERERARERVVAHVVVDEAGDRDVVAHRDRDERIAQHDELEWIAGVPLLVLDEEVEELTGTLALVDPARVEQVRRVAERRTATGTTHRSRA